MQILAELLTNCRQPHVKDKICWTITRLTAGNSMYIILLLTNDYQCFNINYFILLFLKPLIKMHLEKQVVFKKLENSLNLVNIFNQHHGLYLILQLKVSSNYHFLHNIYLNEHLIIKIIFTTKQMNKILKLQNKWTLFNLLFKDYKMKKQVIYHENYQQYLHPMKNKNVK